MHALYRDRRTADLQRGGARLKKPQEELTM
jgi:hypothetical protein